MIVGRTLGQCVIEIGAERLGPESEVVFGAMLYLLSHAGRPVPRRALLELLWPGADEAHARHCLRQTIYRLRRLGVPLDGGVERIGVPMAASTLDHERITGCPAVLLDTPGLLLGAYLPTYAPVFSRAFGDWVEQQRTVVHARLCRATLAVIGELRTQGRFADAEALARVCLELDPLNEEATLVLAESAAMAGSKTEALGILDRYLTDVGGETPELRLPATVLRRRIAERLPAPRYSATLAPAFVGRTTALAELTALWTESRSGTARMCVMWGDAGIGKTRLASELSTMAVVQGARAERVACQPVDARRPLSVFVQLVPRLLAMRGASGVSPESMSHLRRVTDVDPAGDAPEEERPDAAVRYAQVCRAIFDLLEAVTGEGSLVVVIEDAHWLDAASWRLLAEVPRRCLSPRLLLILTSRVAPHALAPADSVAAAASCTPIHLLPLSDEDAGALVDSAAQRRSGRLSAEARASCVRRGAGNPFFLQELTAHVVSGRGTATLPLTVQTLLEERLASVRPRSAQALQAVVLLGRAASVERVEALLEYKTHELVEALEELEAAGLLLIDGQTMGCRHELLAAEAVGRMAPAARLVLHRRAARVLEREIEDSRSSTWLWECASHWAHASDGGRVVRLAVMCGEQLVEMGLPQQAVELLERARPYCACAEQHTLLLASQSTAARMGGDWQTVRTAIESKAAVQSETEHGNVSDRDGDPLYIEALWRTNADTSHSMQRTIERLDDPMTSPTTRLQLATIGLIIADGLGDRRLSQQIYQRAIALPIDSELEAIQQLQVILILETKLGALDTAVDCARELSRRILSIDDPVTQAQVLRMCCSPLLLAGQFDEVVRLITTTYRLCVTAKLSGEAWSTADLAVHVYMELGDILSAQSWFERMNQPTGPHSTTANFRLTSLFIAGRIAVEIGDKSVIKSIRGQLDFAEVALTLPRTQMQLLAVILDLDLASRMAAPKDEQLKELGQLLERFAGTGGLDYASCALLRGLLRSGQIVAAKERLQSYLVGRRERFRPSRALELLAAEVASTASG